MHACKLYKRNNRARSASIRGGGFNPSQPAEIQKQLKRNTAALMAKA
jgi:hypothetical protein